MMRVNLRQNGWGESEETASVYRAFVQASTPRTWMWPWWCSLRLRAVHRDGLPHAGAALAAGRRRFCKARASGGERYFEQSQRRVMRGRLPGQFFPR